MSKTTEFNIIQKYFTAIGTRDDVIVGIGDDCAILTVPDNKQLACTVDTLVEGVHFPVATLPADIAYKSIAVNLSDLAAMGAQPAWLMLSITMPVINHQWLQSFSESFMKTAQAYGVQLIGGDTTQGPLSITVQATGFVDKDHVMRRDKAMPGDKIYVTGTLGDAALGLKLLEDQHYAADEILTACLHRLNRPEPRVAFAGLAVQSCCCAIDISDGLIADLGHILSASHCGAVVNLDQIPISDHARNYFDSNTDGDIDWNLIVAGGDDYELCLVAPDRVAESLMRYAKEMNLTLSCIGEINDTQSLECVDASGNAFVVDKAGYDHFEK